MSKNDPKLTDEENKKSTEDMLTVLRGINEKNETALQTKQKYLEYEKNRNKKAKVGN